MGQNMDEVLAAESDRMEVENEVERSYAHIRPAKEPSQVYSVRIPVARIEEMRRLANEYGQAPSALLRAWVLERLDSEHSRREPEPVIRIDTANSAAHADAAGWLKAFHRHYAAEVDMLRPAV
jgi:hypothetical protein